MNKNIERVELHAHTKMSETDGIISVEELIEHAVAAGHTAVAVTDHAVVQAFPRAQRAADELKQYTKNFKVIYGMEGLVADDMTGRTDAEDLEKAAASCFPVMLLAKNDEGLKNLYELVSKSHTEYMYKNTPYIPKSLLQSLRKGLLIGAAADGELYRAASGQKSGAKIEETAAFYDYFEVQPPAVYKAADSASNETEIKETLRKIAKLGDRLDKPVVAVGNVHFINPKDEISRRVLKNQDPKYQSGLYFRTTDEMLSEFRFLGEEKAYELVVENTNKIADMTDEPRPIKDGFFPPVFENSDRELTELCRARAREIYGDALPDVVSGRLERELELISKSGCSAQFVIANRLAKKSVESGYLVGSRGSVGASFAAFLAGITEINPLPPHYICPNCVHSEFPETIGDRTGVDLPDKVCPICGAPMKKDGFDVPLEIFFGINGEKRPDIDLNFSGEYQAEAQKHASRILGKDHVFRVGVIGTISDTQAVDMTKKYFEQWGLSASDKEQASAAERIIGVKRFDQVHPGGLILSPQTPAQNELFPIWRKPDDPDIAVTHFDIYSLFDHFAVLDVLKHSDPTVLHHLEKETGVSAKDVPLCDPKVIECIAKGETEGITEFGGEFVLSMLKIAKPTTFYELIKISALQHGTDTWIGNARDLIESGAAGLSEVIATREDIMLYLINKGIDTETAYKIAEYVRKGMARRCGLPEEYESLMRSRGVPEWYIDSCKKIGYLFPKAHAISYVMFAARIAYYKVYYPKQFDEVIKNFA